MIEKLRYKFIFITMCSVFVVITGILITLNGFNYYRARDRADEILLILAENDGNFPRMEEPPNNQPFDPFNGPGSGITLETPFETRFFKVVVDSENQILQVDTSRIQSISSADAMTYGETVLEKGETSGYFEDFRFLFVDRENNTNLLLFVDNHRELSTFRSFLQNSILIGSSSLLMILLLVIFFSKKVVAPVQENLEKQQQFITNAGHEIKTPLAIISANNDVQELMGGESEWTRSTKNQVVRLNRLVEEMLKLARIEEEPIYFQKENIDLSQLILEEIVPFRLICEQKGISFSTDVQGDIHILGERESLLELCSILLDNAQKYVSKNGFIQVTLKKEKRFAHFSITNSVDEIPMNFDRLFDRFYRETQSRDQNVSGYGIGLSLARAIVKQHEGTIQAKTDSPQSISFKVKIPL